MPKLVPCHSCGKPCAKSARRCRHCGARRPASSAADRVLLGALGWVAAAVVVIVLCGLLLWWLGGLGAEGTATKTPSEADRLEVVTFCQDRRVAWEAATRDELRLVRELKSIYPDWHEDTPENAAVREELSLRADRLIDMGRNLEFYKLAIERLALGVPANDIQTQVDDHLRDHPEPAYLADYLDARH